MKIHEWSDEIEEMEVFIPRDTVGDVSVCHLTQVIACMELRREELGDFDVILNSLPNAVVLSGSVVERLSEHALQLSLNDPTRILSSDLDCLLVMSCPCKIGSRDDPATHLVIDTSETKPGYLRLEHIPRVAHGERLAQTCIFRTMYGINKSYIKCLLESRTYIHITTNLDEFAKVLLTKIKTNQSLLNLEKNVIMPQLGTQFLHTIYKDRFKHAITCSSTSSGPAINTKFNLNDRISADPDNTICGYLETMLTGMMESISLDITQAIRCNVWPEVAEEWLTRQRSSDWLTSHMIQDIKNHGCYFVQVAHRDSLDPDIEWRFSFTYGEKALAHHLTESQRHCYIVFKTTITTLLKPNTSVSSYCLKNVLFWTLDKIPRDVWENPWTGLGTCFLALLDELIHCLANHILPQYFIPENNLIGHKPRDVIRTALKQLIQIRQKPIHEILEFDKMNPPSMRIIWEPIEKVCSDFIVTSCHQRHKFGNFLDDFIYLCSSKLWNLVQEEHHFPSTTKRFSKIISHVSLLGYRALTKCLISPLENFLSNKCDESTIYRCIRCAWYCFIHLCHNKDQIKYEQLMSWVLTTFETMKPYVNNNSPSPKLDLFYHTYLAIIMHKLQRESEAVNAALRVNDILTGPLYDDEADPYSVYLSKHSAVALHSTLQSLTKSIYVLNYCFITSGCAAYHTLFQCYLDLNLRDYACDVLGSFKDYCERLNPERVYAVMYILAKDQQQIGDYSGAIATYNRLQKTPFGFLIQFDSDRIKCWHQYNDMVD